MPTTKTLSATFAALLLLVLGACAGITGSGSDGEPLALDDAKVPKVYRLSSGDKLRVNVFGEPDLSGEFDVNEGGNITYPLLGGIEAAGRTVSELRESLVDRLNAKYLVDPKVSVEVLNYRPFFILGEVNEPGSYAYQSGMNVRQAVALAGGFTRRAITSEVILIRPADEGEVKLEAGQQARVLPGDTIEVQRRFF